MVERSGKTFFETGGVMGTLRELSKSFLGPRPPLQGGMRYVQICLDPYNIRPPVIRPPENTNMAVADWMLQQ